MRLFFLFRFFARSAATFVAFERQSSAATHTVNVEKQRTTTNSMLNRKKKVKRCVFNSMFSVALDFELETNVHTLLSQYSQRDRKSNFQISKSSAKTRSEISNGVNVKPRAHSFRTKTPTPREKKSDRSSVIIAPSL